MPDSQGETETFRFGEFTLDTGRGALFRSDQELKLRPQSYQVLRLLLENHGQLVTREHLHDAVWGHKAVTDDSLAQCLIDIRKAIGDSNREVIKTVPRRGYVFAAAVDDGPADAVPQSAPRRGRAAHRWLIAVVALLAVGAVYQLQKHYWQSDGAMLENSVAVLPFVALSADEDHTLLADGLSEDILNSLAQIPELNVIARTSSSSFAGQSPDIARIRAALSVEYVLEGSVRGAADQLRVTAQLIDSSDSTEVWSGSFDIGEQELPAVQQEIGNHVVQHILPGRGPVAVADPEIDVLAAKFMQLARLGEREIRERDEVDASKLEEVIRLYRSAILVAPNSALAYARLARALLYQNNLPAAAVAIERALELNSELSEVQETLARYRWLRGEAGAGDAWERAVELNPNNVDAISSYGFWIWMQGDTDRPEAYFRRALQLDPLSMSRYADLGNFFAKGGTIAATDEIISEISALFDTPAGYRVVARLLDLIGRVDESIAWLIKARDLDPGNKLYSGALAELYVDIGDYDTAIKLEPEPGVGLLIKMGRIAEAIDLAEDLMFEQPGDIYLHYLLAYSYNAIGRPEDALRILRRAGLPATVMPETRQAIDLEAFVTYVDALDAAGEIAVGQELAEWWLNRRLDPSLHWWRPLYTACVLAIIDRDDESLEHLEQVAASERLPWMYLLQKSRCFQRYAGEPRYQAVIEHIEQRQAGLRERLPATLAEFGVSLW